MCGEETTKVAGMITEDGGEAPTVSMASHDQEDEHVVACSGRQNGPSDYCIGSR